MKQKSQKFIVIVENLWGMFIISKKYEVCSRKLITFAKKQIRKWLH